MVDQPASSDPRPSTPTSASSPQIPSTPIPSTDRSRTGPSTPNATSSPYSSPMSPTCSTRTFDRGASARPRLSRSSTISSICSARPSFASRHSVTSSSSVSEISSSTPTTTSSRSSRSTADSVTVSRMIDGKSHDVTIHYSKALVAGIQAAGVLRDDFWHLSLKQVEDGTAEGWIKLPPVPLEMSAETGGDRELKKGEGKGSSEDVDVFEAMFSGAGSVTDHPSAGDLSFTILGSESKSVVGRDRR